MVGETRKVDVARHETYMPAELLELRRALRLLHFNASPRTPGSYISTASRDAEAGDPDAIRDRWRAYLKRTLLDVRRTAAEIGVAVLNDEVPSGKREHKRGRRCPSCEVRGRPAARFCDRCGEPFEAVA